MGFYIKKIDYTNKNN